MTLKAKGCGDLNIPKGSVPGTENEGLVALQITGTDPEIGGTANQVVDMTTEGADFVPSVLALDDTFMIIIETAAPIGVQLGNGDQFTITQAQADAYVGMVYPAKLLKVFKAGTTGTFSVVR